MKIQLVLIVLLLTGLNAYHYTNKNLASFRNKGKSHSKKSNKALPTDYNDDDKIAYKMIEKMEAGDKNIRVMIKKNKNFQSMEDLHSLDY